MNSARVDPITRRPYIGYKIENLNNNVNDTMIASGQGFTRVSKLGVGGQADKNPTVVTDYLGKELSSTDHDQKKLY